MFSSPLYALTELGNQADQGSTVLASTERARLAREMMRLDEKDLDGNVYIILIPKGIRTVTASFWAALFGKSIQALGKDAFQGKYFPATPFMDERLIQLVEEEDK